MGQEEMVKPYSLDCRDGKWGFYLPMEITVSRESPMGFILVKGTDIQKMIDGPDGAHLLSHQSVVKQGGIFVILSDVIPALDDSWELAWAVCPNCISEDFPKRLLPESEVVAIVAIIDKAQDSAVVIGLPSLPAGSKLNCGCII